MMVGELNSLHLVHVFCVHVLHANTLIIRSWQKDNKFTTRDRFRIDVSSGGKPLLAKGRESFLTRNHGCQPDVIIRKLF